MSNREMDRLRENVDRALRALETAARAVQAATSCETAAREAVRRARAALDEERAREQRDRRRSKTGRPADLGLVSRQAGLPAKRKKGSVSIALLQSRGLWKPSPIGIDRGGKHHLVKDESPRAPLTQLSHDDARDLWNN